MYQAFFGFREKPFNLTPDPKFFYLNASYREALAALHYGISERKGFVSLIGEAGTGKTTLLRRLLAEFTPETRSVLVLNPAVGFEELLRFILSDLGRPPDPGTPKLEMLESLNAELLDTLAKGGNVVVLVDEAQDLTIPVLEELRLLSNLETAKEKILQFVLAGQPELEAILTRPEIRQLRQRIVVRARLRPLARAEVKAYVAARIAAAGGDDRGLFNLAALHRLWRFSRGVPRLVNVACDNALVTAYAAGQRSIGWRIMGEAIRDLVPAAAPRAARGGGMAYRVARILVAAVIGGGVGLGALHLAGGTVAFAPPNGPTGAASVSLAAAPREPGVRGGAAAMARAPRAEPPASGGPARAPDAAPAAGVARFDPAAPPREAAPVPDAPPRVPPEVAPARDGPERPQIALAADVPDDTAREARRAPRMAPAADPASPAPATAAAEDAAPDLIVQVRQGDTLTEIARAHYATVPPHALDRVLEAIMRANPSLEDANVILTGRALVLPAVRLTPGEGGATVVAAPR